MARGNMRNEYHRGFTALTASEFVVGIAAAIVGIAFLAEGLDGYLYNASIFWEGLDHIWEIAGGLVVAACGAVGAVLVYRWR